VSLLRVSGRDVFFLKFFGRTFRSADRCSLTGSTRPRMTSHGSTHDQQIWWLTKTSADQVVGPQTRA
jgi:hypothetical protein